MLPCWRFYQKNKIHDSSFGSRSCSSNGWVLVWVPRKMLSNRVRNARTLPWTPNFFQKTGYLHNTGFYHVPNTGWIRHGHFLWGLALANVLGKAHRKARRLPSSLFFCFGGMHGQFPPCLAIIAHFHCI